MAVAYQDIGRVLGVDKNTVISRIKGKTAEMIPVNPHIGSETLAAEIRHLIDPSRIVIQNPAHPWTGSQQIASGKLMVVDHTH